MRNEKDTILANIRDIRNYRKLSQENVAGELQIDTSTYSKIESGKIDLTISRLAELAHIFQMRTIDLITWPDQFVNENEKPEKVKAVLQIELNKEKKDEVLQLLFGATGLEILNR